MKRILFLLKLYAVMLLAFVLQKPLFMFYNDSLGRDVAFTDYFRVIIHGLTLDGATAGYMMALPWLLIIASIWVKNIPMRKCLTWYYVLVSLFICTICVSDASLYPFWGFKMDATIFQFLDSPKNAFASVSTGFIAIRTIITIIFTAVLSFALYKVTPKVLSDEKHCRKTTLWSVLFGGILFVIIRGGVTESTSNIGQAYFCNDEFLNHSAVNPVFSMLYSMGKTTNYDDEFNFFEESQRNELFEGLYPNKGENITELLNNKRPNILILLMEGYGGVFIEPLGGEKDVAPNLNRLSKEGIFFTNCYANSYRTDRGTICALSGYQSFPTHSVMKIPAKSRTLPAIAGKLAKEGYKTDFLYGGDINFTNMKGYLLTTGYQKLTADVDFKLTDLQNVWGVNDDITFEWLYNDIKNRKEGPWHTTFLTLSSHDPFDVPFDKFEDKIKNSFAFTDYHLGKFIERLKNLPQWKDMLVICLPDHGFYYPREGMVHAPRIHHIPMIWLGGAIKKPMEVNTLMNQTDLAATLLGQLGISHSEFNFSRNITGEEYKYPFAYYTYNNGFAFIDSTGVTMVDNNSGKTVIDEPAANERRKKLGEAILQTSHDDLSKR